MSEAKTAVKITIGKKVIIARNPVNEDIENAMRITGQQMNGSEDKNLYMFKMQDNLLKELLISVDGDTDVRKPLDDMFNLVEKTKAAAVVQKMAGLGNEVKVTEEIVTL